MPSGISHLKGHYKKFYRCSFATYSNEISLDAILDESKAVCFLHLHLKHKTTHKGGCVLVEMARIGHESLSIFFTSFKSTKCSRPQLARLRHRCAFQFSTKAKQFAFSISTENTKPPLRVAVFWWTYTQLL